MSGTDGTEGESSFGHVSAPSQPRGATRDAPPRGAGPSSGPAASGDPSSGDPATSGASSGDPATSGASSGDPATSGAPPSGPAFDAPVPAASSTRPPESVALAWAPLEAPAEPGRPSPPTRRTIRDAWAPPAALVGVVLSVGVAFVLSAQAGCFVLSGVLLLAAVVRALDPGDGPSGVAVRSKTFDVSLLSTFAVVIAVLAATASGV